MFNKLIIIIIYGCQMEWNICAAIYRVAAGFRMQFVFVYGRHTVQSMDCIDDDAADNKHHVLFTLDRNSMDKQQSTKIANIHIGSFAILCCRPAIDAI